MRTLFIILLIISLTPIFSHSDEYDFDVTEFESKKYELNYYLDMRPSGSFLNKNSRIFKLYFNGENKGRYQDNFNILTGITGDYKFSKNSIFVFDGILSRNYLMNDIKKSQAINEAYLKLDRDSRFRINIGKKTFKWGKGYSWNPVNFAGVQKDINDIELSLEGFTSISTEYNRTLKGYLSNITLTNVILPVSKNLNEGYTPHDSFNFISQLYLLMGNTDIDLYFMGGSGGNHKTGFDFSRNISSNWEIHGEFAHEFDSPDYSINNKTVFENNNGSVNKWLLGTRYLDLNEITYILEYIHNDAGFSTSEMNQFYYSADQSLLNNNTVLIKTMAGNYNQYLNKQFFMKNYIYFKMSKPELFNELYINGSISSIYNIADESSMASFELNYTGKSNQIYTIKYNINTGSSASEFGQKLSSDKLELRFKRFF